jgi:hypothetical protein
MQAYEQALKGQDTRLVVSPNFGQDHDDVAVGLGADQRCRLIAVGANVGRLLLPLRRHAVIDRLAVLGGKVDTGHAQIDEELRGEGDAERNRILAEAFSQDANFFAFYRSMQAYEQALKGQDIDSAAGTPIKGAGRDGRIGRRSLSARCPKPSARPQGARNDAEPTASGTAR